MLVAARAELEQETNRAREALRAKVGELAVAAAEKILQREIDAAANQDIVDSFAKQI
jgi:F-type H+-transporting ATPase subunit b